MSLPLPRKKKLCPWCHRTIPTPRTFSVLYQQKKAIKWLIKNRRIWEDYKIEQFEPMRVSLGWKLIAVGLKHDGIYKSSYCDWDMSIDLLVKKAKEKLK